MNEKAVLDIPDIRTFAYTTADDSVQAQISPLRGTLPTKYGAQVKVGINPACVALSARSRCN